MADENDPTDEANDPDAEETGASTDFGGNESESTPDAGEAGEGDDEEKSFRERVEEIRERRAEEGEEGDRERPNPEEMMGGGGGGGNPFAQMMSGMMGGGGGGPPGMGGGGGPPGMGGGPGGRGGHDPRGREEESGGNEELVREVRQLRDEVRDATRQLQRIAQAIEDN